MITTMTTVKVILQGGLEIEMETLFWSMIIKIWIYLSSDNLLIMVIFIDHLAIYWSFDSLVTWLFNWSFDYVLII